MNLFVHNRQDGSDHELSGKRSVNEALPGKHWDVPPYQEIKNCFMEREAQPNEELKNEIVLKFLKEHIQPNKLDKFSLMIGLATPPAAMAAKKAGERVPQLKFMKSVPDILFVPGATLLALTGVRFSRIFFLQQKHLKSEDHLVERNHIGTSDS
ncbi:uncharacterized protein LOC132644473 [Lycium barbarum]|uniref:uncharacterized protein LOC132644473 n=1 Tax=Lycium barbarum TaxID=112863 RepID=UPI00293F5993|nr:uncharacterized protein LOC132644473 [Lycium barbarum]